MGEGINGLDSEGRDSDWLRLSVVVERVHIPPETSREATTYMRKVASIALLTHRHASRSW